MKTIFLFLTLLQFPSCTNIAKSKISNKLEIQKIQNLTWIDDANIVTNLTGASGIIYHSEKYFIISDESNKIGVFKQLDGSAGISLTILPPFKNHKNKPDLESIMLLYDKPDTLLAFPSGSKKNRSIGSFIAMTPTGEYKVENFNLKKIFKYLKKSVKKINIEGVATNSKKIFLAQRGNDKNGQNQIIAFDKNCFIKMIKQINQQCPFESIVFELDSILNVKYTFTDINIYDENSLLFLAAAEDTESISKDGNILGSIIGEIDLEERKVKWSKKLSLNIKAEGLYITKKSDKKLDILITSDMDNSTIASEIYSATLNID